MSQHARAKRSEGGDEDAADDFDLTDSRLAASGKERPGKEKKTRPLARARARARLPTPSLPQ